MKLSISNTGRHVTFCATPEMVAYLNHALKPNVSGKFNFSFENGRIMIRPWAGTGHARSFCKSRTGRTLVATYPTESFPGGDVMPVFGRIVIRAKDLNSSGPNTVEIMLPDTLPAGTPRMLNLRKRARPGAVPGKFAGWRNEETRRRSLEGLAKARATAMANRKRRALKAATSTVKEILSDQPTLRAIGQASLNGSPAPQPTTNGMANLTLQVGNKTVNYQVPEDELYEYAFELSEKGYRLK